METENSSRRGGAKMAFHIDLNEAPIPSPREVVDDAVLGSAGVSVCTMCRRGVSAGRKATEEQRQEFKCFRCLLKNDGGSGNSGGGEVGRFDINASPPLEAEECDDVAVLASRVGHGGSKIQASTDYSLSSYRDATRQVNPVLEDIPRNLPRPSSVPAESAHSSFRDMLRHKVHSNFGTIRNESTYDVGTRGSLSTASDFPPESPSMLYLQTLREYVAERSGVLGEGWRVEFEFCNKRYKTSAVYISPDGRKLKSMEDVASHLGLPPRYHNLENENGSNDFAFIQSGLKMNSAKNDSSAFLASQSSRQRQKTLRGCNSSGFLSGPGSDVNHNGFPIQFQDFCLISAGSVDSRPSYHNTDLIWPVGYRSSWHDRVTGSLFVCDIADGGDCGPIFKVQRHSCTLQAIPVGSTILSKTKSASCKGDDKVLKEDVAAIQVVDDESISTITLLSEDSPPCLENCLSTSKREDEVHNSREDNSSNSDLEFTPQRTGNSIGDAVGLNDIIGEFQVEGRSTSYVWEMVSQAFVHALRDAYKQKGAVKLFCGHDVFGTNNENLDSIYSLSRYSYFNGLASIPPLVQNEKDFHTACDMLLTWLNQDRFGVDADFVQEIFEQLPGVNGCSEYKKLNERKQSSCLHTIGSGFLHAERKTNISSFKRSQLKLGETEDNLNRDPCPPGKPLKSKLPSYLIGDALQVWELAFRFSEVLGLGQPFSFQELELELVNPWLDSYPLDSRLETLDTGNASPSPGEKVSQSGTTGLLLAKILGSLLKLLVSEVLSKAAVYVCPNFDAGESKSRRGRKKDLDCLAALKKTKLDMLPVNELTWHEIARRYILAVLSMEGNLDSTEIASRESGKVFHCLRGDGGILCGSLTGIAALEGDAMVLSDAQKEIFGSLKSKNDVVTVCESESDVNGAQTIEVDDGVVPEWAQVLEPVRKLPTNVGARIRRCINEALEKNPPEWAKKILEHSISKEVYKGNASGPTKRAVISVLANVSSENPQQKAEKKEKVKVKTSLSDLITKQCRIVLRRAAASDEDRVFCNLLARIILSPNDNDDEGILGYPAMVSRPLDFRTIDLRLAAGAYGGSHEAFVDDVREVWRNIRTAYGDRSDLIEVAESLLKKFEDLYEKEVLSLVHKIAEISNVNDSSAEAIKERDDLLVHVCNSSIPRAPWDEGICKVCGMDKDDDNVLLCDKCDSEYHRYCLNPPLLRIPEGNWYCPSCVSGQSKNCGAVYGSVANQSRKSRYHGEFTSKFLEELVRLANLMEIKECWEFTIEERMFFMKFLFDEALNSATIRDHVDQCASRAADLQHKLRSLTSEFKLLKVKEDMFGLNTEKPNSGVFNGRGDLKSDASSSLNAIENSSRAKPPPVSGNLTQLEGDTCLNEQADYNKHPNWLRGTTSWQNELPIQPQTSDQRQNFQGSHLSGGQVGSTPVSSIQESSVHCSEQAEVLSLQDNSVKVGPIKNDILNLQESIASIELELLKVSLRKDFLGRDSNGRVYWVFHSHGARPWVVACGDLISKERGPHEFINIPDSDKWMYYESDDEIEKLIGWLRESNLREKELRESILQLQSNKLKDLEYTENHILSQKGESNLNVRVTSSDFLASKALNSLENKFGSCLGVKAADIRLDGNMYRCECLELLWPSKDHCLSCHNSFPTTEELRQHSKENCKEAPSVSKRSQTTDDNSKRKKLRSVASEEKRPLNASILQKEKQNDGSNFGEHHSADCPFNFEEIMTRFIVPSSVKDAVNEIGLIGNGGILSFSPSGSPYLSDPALALGPTRINEVGSNEIPKDLRNLSNEASAGVRIKDNKELGELNKPEGGSNIERLRSVLLSERDQGSSIKDKNSLVGLLRNSIIRESSSKPLVGRASEILRLLKIHLLDVDAALPEDALRKSRLNQERRFAWRAFVKSARSIYEMVQATIVLEDTIKSEYLQNDWWYWSSPSTAAKITTLSALALRIYSLDAAVSYEKPLPDSTTEILEPNCALDEESPLKNLANPSSPQLQKTPEPDSAENPRTRSRTSKRKKDLNG